MVLSLTDTKKKQKQNVGQVGRGVKGDEYIKQCNIESLTFWCLLLLRATGVLFCFCFCFAFLLTSFVFFFFFQLWLTHIIMLFWGGTI